MDFHSGSGFGSSFASNILPINHLAPYLNSGPCPALSWVTIRPPTPLETAGYDPPVIVKFIYSEKATNFCEISTVDLSNVVTVKSKIEISQNFVAFSEYMNFNLKSRWPVILYIYLEM